MTLLSLEGVTRRYGGLVAVDTVDLDVAEGGVTAVIGPNGAGKTTLFNLVSGFQKPNAGRIVFAGEDITMRLPEQIAASGLVRTFQLVQLFQKSFSSGERPGRLPSPHQGRKSFSLDAQPRHA